MTNKRKFKYYITFFIMVVFFLISTPSVSATENSRNLNLDFKIVQEHLETTIINGSDGLNINLHSEEYNENSYAYIYQENRDNWGSYEAIVLQVKNNSNNPVSMNLQIVSESQGKFMLKENGVILLENGETKAFRQGKMIYSNMEIPFGFEGNIYISLDNFINKENNTMISSSELENITSWGITFIPSNNGENSIDLKKVELLKKEDLNTVEQVKNINITGSDQVQIPMVGEIIEFYKANGTENVKVSLLEDYKGVRLTEDGKLSLTSEADEIDIVLEININNEVKYEKVVSLKHSWAFNQVDQDGVPYGLLPPEKSPTTNETNKFKGLESSMIFIKAFLVTICIACVIVYMRWKNEKTKRN